MCTVSVALRSSLAALLVLVAIPAAAQDWDQPWADSRDRPPRVDVSASTGFLVPTDWSDLVLLGTISPAFGILEQVLVQDVRVDPDVKLGVAATYWRGRHGFRADVGYSRSTLSIGGAPLGIGGESVGVRTWLYGVRAMAGLVEYTPQRRVLPYAFVGIGGITYDLNQPVSPPLLTFIERPGPGANATSELIIFDEGREFILQVDELSLETTLEFSFGAGADLRIPFGPAGVGLRLEVADHVARSPVRLLIRELGAPASDTRVEFGRVHHLRASAGVVVTLGR